MKQVLQCDHCSETIGIDKVIDMVLHEGRCRFNPELKKCQTCQFWKEEPYCTWHSCETHSEDYSEEVQEGVIKCKTWKQEE